METVRFEDLGLYPEILRAVTEMGFEEATPIQAKSIPVVKDSIFRYPTASEDRSPFKKDTGNRALPDQRTGNPGGK